MGYAFEISANIIEAMLAFFRFVIIEKNAIIMLEKSF